MTSRPRFHLAFPVRDLREARAFYGDLLGCPQGRSSPEWIDFDSVPGLKAEARVKLKKIQPRTFGQAARISGINPTDVALLQVHTKRGKSASLLR